MDETISFLRLSSPYSMMSSSFPQSEWQVGNKCLKRLHLHRSKVRRKCLRSFSCQMMLTKPPAGKWSGLLPKLGAERGINRKGHTERPWVHTERLYSPEKQIFHSSIRLLRKRDHFLKMFCLCWGWPHTPTSQDSPVSSCFLWHKFFFLLKVLLLIFN